MEIFNYISQANPDGALSVFREYAPSLRVRDPEELSSHLQSLYKSLSETDRNIFLQKIATVHPDKDLIQESTESIQSDSSDDYTGHTCNCSNCTVNSKLGADGMKAVGDFMSSDLPKYNDLTSPNQTSLLSQELNTMKLENTTKKLLNDRIFQLILVGAVIYLFYQNKNK